MTVHNHGIDPSCRERKVGECLLAEGTVVLDLHDAPSNGTQPVALTLRDVSYLGGPQEAKVLRFLADQIEEQTKPARIPEPGWGKKVIAHTERDKTRRQYVRFYEGDGIGAILHWYGRGQRGAVKWDDLIDPEPTPEGI
jgi:hypothetical protein